MMRLIRAFFILGLFFYTGAVGIVCAKEQSTKLPVVAPSGKVAARGLEAASSASRDGGVNSAEVPWWLVYIPLPMLVIALLTVAILLSKGFPNNVFVKNEEETKRKAGKEFDEKEKEKQDKTDYECYQDLLKEELGTISLLGTHALENIPVNLTDTFVSLRLSDTWRSEKRPYFDTCHVPQKEESVRTPEEVMMLVFETCRLLLVIGDPGSGKTTLLKYYALSCLENKQYKELGFKKPVQVFYIPLRELTIIGADYASLPHSLSVWSKKHSLEIPESVFFDWLHHKGSLLLLDGLDEISDQEQRIKVCAWIDLIVTRFKHARIVVTSRYTGYRKGDGIELKSRHTRADIMDFTDKQQAEFLEKWFNAALLRELRPPTKNQQEWERNQQQKAREKAATIIEFLNKKENKSLLLLAAVPMLLQIMAILWKERQYLPETRVELYNAAINYILDYRDRQRELYPLLSTEDARRVLTPLSLWMQEELKKDEAGRGEMQQKMQIELDTLTTSCTASEFCQNLVDRAGLLVEYGDKEYRFRHKSFREYMAGVQLEKKMHRTLGHLEALVGHFGNDWWEEPLRFFIGQVDAEIFDAFMEKLFDSQISLELTQKQQDLLITLIQEAPQKKIDALQKKLLHPQTSPNRQRYLLECMKTIGKQDALDAVRTFAAAGITNDAQILRLAAEINGNKEVRGRVFRKQCGVGKAVDVFVDMQGAQYIMIEGGTFTYSLTKRPVNMHDLYVAKYTVTNKLYRQFISYLDAKDFALAKGLPIEQYSKTLRSEVKSAAEFGDYLEGEKSWAKLFASKYDDDKRFNKEDQPVVGVSWYAARAYCLWLSMLESNGQDSALYRLPTEKEWEYAAAGKEGRQYPWGNAEPTAKLANYDNNEGATTPAGRYPEGITPEGLYDMAGNVWEWMEDIHEKYAPARALRGGSWFNGPGFLRCAARSYVRPADGFSDFGFRVVRSSPSS